MSSQAKQHTQRFPPTTPLSLSPIRPEVTHLSRECDIGERSLREATHILPARPAAPPRTRLIYAFSSG